jgi:hypothetical protein
MYNLNKNYLKGINLDFIKRTNYIKNVSKKGEKFNLFFFNNKIKKEQKRKLKQTFALELISMQKALFSFSLKKTTRKTTYISTKVISYINKKYLYSFLFFFSQYYFAHLQNFSKLAINLKNEKVDIDILNTIDYIKKNQEILKLFSAVFLEDLKKKNQSYNKYSVIQYLSFFKLKI